MTDKLCLQFDSTTNAFSRLPTPYPVQCRWTCAAKMVPLSEWNGLGWSVSTQRRSCPGWAMWKSRLMIGDEKLFLNAILELPVILLWNCPMEWKNQSQSCLVKFANGYDITMPMQYFLRYEFRLISYFLCGIIRGTGEVREYIAFYTFWVRSSNPNSKKICSKFGRWVMKYLLL